MLRSKFYVCPVCGNSIHSMGEAVIQCHGIMLKPCQAEKTDENHMVFIERIEDEYYIRVEHDMTKQHYISFIAAVSPDKLQMVKLYPEGNAEARFKINGVIEAGSGGAEKEANYELMEPVTKKYYKYSDAYGVSDQYKKFRTWFMWNDLNSVKSIIDDAIKEKKWVVFSAHSFDEISQDDMRVILDYIKSKSTDEIDVVNWNYIYENFGEFVEPTAPAGSPSVK